MNYERKKKEFFYETPCILLRIANPYNTGCTTIIAPILSNFLTRYPAYCAVTQHDSYETESLHNAGDIQGAAEKSNP